MKTYSESTPAGGHDPAADNDHHAFRPRFTDQLPAIVLTAALIIGATAWMRTQDEVRRAEDLKSILAQNEALRTQADDNRRQTEATARLLKEAVARHDGEVFRTEEEVQKLNNERMNLLADTIAKKVLPAIPAPKAPAEVEQQQAAELDKVAARFTDNLRPMLTEAIAESNSQKAASAQTIHQYEERVRQLDNNVQVAQTAAQDALKLTHEVSALYLQSFRDQGVLFRLVALPANLVGDAVKLNLISNRDRAKVREELSAKMNEIDQRLLSVQTAGLADKS